MSAPSQKTWTIDEYLRATEAAHSSDGFVLRKWTSEEFRCAGLHGLFRDDEKLELLMGLIFRLPRPQSPSHYCALRRVADGLASVPEPPCHVRQQAPLALSDASEPVPDVALVKGSVDDYFISHPGPGDVLLVVEVCDGDIEVDRGIKVAIYAQSGIPEYWIVDLGEKLLRVYKEPIGGVFYFVRLFGEGDSVTFRNTEIAVSSLVSFR